MAVGEPNGAGVGMRNGRKSMAGVVVSDKMKDTVVVQVTRTKRHRVYGKVIRVSKRHKAHDEGNRCRVGDEVQIVESRPLSKEKRWVVEQIIKRAA